MSAHPFFWPMCLLQAYKNKQFEAAIAHYNRAFEIFDEDISFLTNRWDALREKS